MRAGPRPVFGDIQDRDYWYAFMNTVADGILEDHPSDAPDLPRLTRNFRPGRKTPLAAGAEGCSWCPRG